MEVLGRRKSSGKEYFGKVYMQNELSPVIERTDGVYVLYMSFWRSIIIIIILSIITLISLVITLFVCSHKHVILGCHVFRARHQVFLNNHDSVMDESDQRFLLRNLKWGR